MDDNINFFTFYLKISVEILFRFDFIICFQISMWIYLKPVSFKKNGFFYCFKRVNFNSLLKKGYVWLRFCVKIQLTGFNMKITRLLNGLIFLNTAWKMSKDGVFSGPYLDTFNAVENGRKSSQNVKKCILLGKCFMTNQVISIILIHLINFRVSGKPVFNGFDKVTLEAMVWTGKPSGVSIAVVLDRVRLDEVLEQILGMSDIPMAWFSEMKIGTCWLVI